MSRNVAVLAAAATPVGRLQSRAGDELQNVEHEILGRLVIQAVGEAGIDKTEVGSLVFSHPRVYTQQLYFATFMANYLKLTADAQVVEVMGNGMTGGLAFDQAMADVASGRADVALALGINMETAAPTVEHMNRTMRTTGDIDFHTPFGFTPISWYAMDATRYMHDTGAGRADLAAIAVKDRGHAALNPIAQYRQPITLEEVLAQRPIVEPLGLYEVPPRSDGAACIVLAAEEVAVKLGRPYVRIRGRGFFHEGAHQINESGGDMTAFVAAQRAAATVYEQAGAGAGDMDFAELYAPCTIVQILVAEALGLVPRGEGWRAASAGEMQLGGRIPVCTSGGCLSRGHPPYVTPLYGMVEMVEQLLGRAGRRQVEGARLGITSSELGNYNAALLHVMEAAA
ncbi:MAG: thiolase family protein [Alphaproteobacteria bacterium]|jgi:acetyl-CoA acetyltransferase|nr:thiolase family protein [Alphaproteobacteria bacterium]MDP6564778.1 thiolase family protein [Alphaproteobacteria bacterium]MDP6814127.1 thiolase family protein [Alphaproteobacteria bacterium]